MRRAPTLLSLALSALTLWSCTSDTPPPSRRPDVVLVTIDTLRADHATATVMPSLAALAARGMRFTAARTVAPLTLPAHTSVMTGLYPPRHGVRLNGGKGLSPDVPTLAQIFRTAGYDTAAFIGAFVLDRRFGLAEGFAHYDDRIDRDASAMDKLEAERRGSLVVDGAIEWLTRRERPPDRPLFLWVHLYDPHAPYAPPASAAPSSDPYRGEVEYADQQLGRLLAVLSSRGCGDGGRGGGGRPDCVVVVVSDHGESLGDHGEPGHGMLLYESAMRIPFVIAGPGVAHGERHDPVSLVDVAPTVLARTGLAPLASIDGHDLFAGPPPADRQVYGETEYPRLAGWAPLAMLANARWKLVDAPAPELYEIAGDASESSNQAAAHSSVVVGMRQWLVSLRARSVPVSSTVVTAEAERRLRTLGYVAGATPALPSATAPNPAAMMREWTSFESALAQQASGGRAASSLAVFERLARSHAESALFVTTWARALAAAGRHREALSIYRTAATRWPGDSALAHDRAVSAREVGLRDEAMNAERAALEIDASNALAHNGLGLMLAEAGRQAEARASFERAAALDPTNAGYQVHLGNAARELADVPAAEGAYRAALAIDADNADALNGLGVLLVQSGRPGDALPWLERAIARDSDFIEARLNLGIARQQSGDLAGARSAYEEVLQSPRRFSREQAAARALLASLK